MKKAQSAIEYLTTYGWMLVVVAITSGIVFSAVEPSCSNSVTGLLGTSFAVENVGTLADSEGIALQIRNDREDRVEINKFKFQQDDKTYIYEPNQTMRPGSVEGFSIPGFVSSESCNTIDMKIIHSIGPKNGQITGQQVTAELESEVELGNLKAPSAPENLSANYTGPNYEPPKESKTSTLTWNSNNLDQGLDNGVVHESTPNTSYDDASVIRKGDPTDNPLYEDSLVAWYPLQEFSGSTANDFSGNNYDGAVSGATQAGGTDLAGLPTYGFDGENDYLNTQVIDFDFRTISLWFYNDKEFSGGEDYEMLFADESDAGTWLALGEASSGVSGETLSIGTTGTGEITSITNTITVGWHNVILVYNGNTYDIYLDGNEKSTVTGGSEAQLIQNEGLDLGAREVNSDGWFEGSISDFRFYNKSFSSSEAQNVYNLFGSNSSHETVYKGSSVDSSPSINFTSVNIPTGSNATLEVLEDSNKDGSVEKNDTINLQDGVADYGASGLSGSGELSLNVTISNSDLSVGSSVEVPVNVTGEN